MKLKKILSICLVGALAATLLAGCGSSDETVGEEIKDDAEEVVEDVKDVAEEVGEDVKDVAEDVGEGVKDAVEDVGEDVKDAAEEAVDDVKENAEETKDEIVGFEGFEQLTTIIGYGLSMFDTPGIDEVIEGINEVSIAEINVELDYTALEPGAYAEQVGLMLAGGERIDLVMIVPMDACRFSVMLAQNQLMDISDLVYTYAPEAMEFLDAYVEPFVADGGLYGLPSFQDYNKRDYIIMRKDVLDYLGLTEQAEAISSWTDLEAIYAAVYDAQDELPEDLQTPNMVGPIGDGVIIPFGGRNTSTDDFSGHYATDWLSSADTLVYVDEDGKVQDNFESDGFKDMMYRVRQWYENDWVYKDSANATDSADTFIKNGACFSIIQEDIVGVEEVRKSSTGYDVVCVAECPQLITSGSVTGFGWAVPVTSDEPEAAVAFLNLMFTNSDIENYFVWGIEGRDYELNDAGEAVILEGAQYQGDAMMFGNQFLVYPNEGQGTNYRELSREDLDTAEISPYFGFSVDTDPISGEVNAINAVLSQYKPGLSSGTVDPDEVYDTFIDAMYDAGLQTLIDYYQEALDEWLANR